MNEGSDTTKTNPAESTENTATKGDAQETAPKTYTQNEVNDFVRKRINEINAKKADEIKQAVNDALAERDRQAKMSDEQKADEALKKRNEAIDKRERDVTLRERRSEAMAKLIEKEIPTELVDYVVEVDADKTAENIDKLAETWNKAIDAKVKEKLAGTTPKDRSNGGNTTNKSATPSGVYSKNGISAF